MSRVWLKKELCKDKSLLIHKKFLSKYLINIYKIVLCLTMGLCLREALMNVEYPKYELNYPCSLRTQSNIADTTNTSTV